MEIQKNTSWLTTCQIKLLLTTTATLLFEIIGFSKGIEASAFIYYTNLSNALALFSCAFFIIAFGVAAWEKKEEKEKKDNQHNRSNANDKKEEKDEKIENASNERVNNKSTTKNKKDMFSESNPLLWWAIVVKYVATCMTTLTLVVVLCILVPMQGITMLYMGNFLYFHVICPILMLVSCVWMRQDKYACVDKGKKIPQKQEKNRTKKREGEKEKNIFTVERTPLLRTEEEKKEKKKEKKEENADKDKRKILLLGMLPTLLYGSIAIILNGIGILEGPYPFLMVTKQPIIMSIIWGVVVVFLAYKIASILWTVIDGTSRNGAKK